MSEHCKWLHEQLEQLPLFKYKFNENCIPLNGIYFFYEKGEIWGHDGEKQRIVRIGTANNCNFRQRIKEHYLLNISKMNFDKNKPKPSDRSIFRKNIGRILLRNDDYFEIWEKDFIKKENRIEHGNNRDIQKEKNIEKKITDMIQKHFTFRFIIIDNQIIRKGCKELEGLFIGTIAGCESCKPSDNWLGKNSPVGKIRNSGLWQVQCLKANRINENNKNIIANFIIDTKNWLERNNCI